MGSFKRKQPYGNRGIQLRCYSEISSERHTTGSLEKCNCRVEFFRQLCLCIADNTNIRANLPVHYLLTEGFSFLAAVTAIATCWQR